MAIDTTEKKLSLLSFGNGGFVLPLTLDGQAELQHLLGLYSGILVSEAAAASGAVISFAVRFTHIQEVSIEFASIQEAAVKFPHVQEQEARFSR